MGEGRHAAEPKPVASDHRSDLLLPGAAASAAAHFPRRSQLDGRGADGGGGAPDIRPGGRQ